MMSVYNSGPVFMIIHIYLLVSGIRQARKDTRPSPSSTTGGHRYHESDGGAHTCTRALLSKVMKLHHRGALSTTNPPLSC